MSEVNPNNNNLLNRLFNVFNWQIKCECCGSRKEGDPEMSLKPASSGANVARSTATSELDRGSEATPLVNIDKNYMENLLQGLKETYNENPATPDPSAIQKKKNTKSTNPRWNSVLEQILMQAVNLYGSDIDLLHAFFPGFKREFIERKVKKATNTLQKKKRWSKEDDARLLALINADVTDLATIMGKFPEKSLEAILQRGRLLKDSSKQAGEDELIVNELNPEEEEDYDFNKIVTGNTSEDYSLSDTMGLESENQDIDIGLDFNPIEAGFSFNFEPDKRIQNIEFDQTPRNQNNLTGGLTGGLGFFNQSSKNPFEANLDSSNPYKDHPFSDIYEQQINKIFPSKKQSFNEMLEEKSFKGEKSAVENFLDFNKDLQRSRTDSAQNSPTTILRVRPFPHENGPSFGDDF